MSDARSGNSMAEFVLRFAHLEAFMGAFMMALFIAVLGKKMTQ